MSDLFKEIENIISDCNNNIESNILGINYLEKLKYFLIDKIKEFETIDINIIQKSNNQEIRKKFNQNNLIISIFSNLDPLLKIKQNVENDILCIVIEGYKSLKIFKDINSKDAHSINLFSKMGIVLSKNMIISQSIGKKSFILYIENSLEN